MNGERENGYEHSDAHVRPLALFGAGLAVLILAVLLVSHWILSSFESETRAEQAPDPLASLREPPAGPRLQANPAEELAEERRREDELLSQYGWIDATNGVVRIPIERAMALLAERGITPPPPPPPKDGK